MSIQRCDLLITAPDLLQSPYFTPTVHDAAMQVSSCQRQDLQNRVVITNNNLHSF